MIVRYDDEKDNCIFVELPYENGNKQAALAEAALKVAAQVGAKMRLEKA